MVHHSITRLRKSLYIILLALFAALSGCLPSPYFQRVETIPGDSWDYKFKPVFEVDIPDSVSDFRPYLIIRHTQGYPFSNIWLVMHIKGPGDTTARKERVNVMLAEASGKWMGRGMGEVWEQRMYLKMEDTTLFRKKGTWQISLEQNMRVNPLPEILNIGFRLERTGLHSNQSGR